jgi:hypothetical protein
MDLKKELESSVAHHLKVLIESKHLYQGIRIEANDVLEKALSQAGGSYPDQVNSGFSSFLYGPWLAHDPCLDHLALRQGTFTNLVFSMPGVKLFCGHCERVEAFNSVSTEEFLGRGGYGEPVVGRETIQVFVASFLCQSCKTVPEVFVIHRQGIKLTISGRAPIETVNAPKQIPRGVRHYYASALVAHHSGQSLCANFLLRTLIEQWTRKYVATSGPRLADEILDL